MEEIRINKYLAMSGICSRRMADKYIEDGFVAINGITVTDLSTKVKESDSVYFKSRKIDIEKNIYIMLNKPKGYVTTVHEQFGRKSVLDLIDESLRIYPVGRLDMFSEGMLLLTNDGDFTNKITHPTKHIEKTYEVLLNKEITNEKIEELEKGVDIGGYITRPCKVNKINKGKIIVKISEGKNRQVRKMLDAIGYKVINLKRVAIGKLKLENLELGKYKYLDENDIKKIFE